MCAIFVVPIHCANSVKLLNAKHLFMIYNFNENDNEWAQEIVFGICSSPVLTGHRSWLISSNVFFGFWCMTYYSPKGAQLRITYDKIWTKLIPNTL